ncbi:MAG: NAD(P)-dependent oxidoreductase [Candidatus Humimicrobiaceae bacterium]
MQKLKILIISDLFIKYEIVKKIIIDKLSNKYELSFENLFYDWPVTPHQNNDEVKEYVGSINEIKKFVKNIDILIVHCAPITKEIIDNSNNLKAIGVVRGGPVNINIDAVSKKKIPIFSAPGRNANAVAEFIIGLIINELRYIRKSHIDLVFNNFWNPNYYIYDNCNDSISKQIVGTVGIGNIGEKLSKLLSCFGCKVLAYDPYVDEKIINSYGAEKVDLDELLKLSDIVTINARLTSETKNMVDINFFNKMKPTALFINTARGEIVNYKDLFYALNNGLIKHAAVDVYDIEPISTDNPLLRLDNITFTPHIAGANKEAVYLGINLIAEEIGNYLENKKIENCINCEIFDNL